MAITARQHAPATERNRQPILDVLQQVLPSSGIVLEVSSGTGEHITFFAPRLKHLQWLPSEPQAIARQSVQSWAKERPSKNLILPPLNLDVSVQPWPVETASFKAQLAEPITAVVNINMIHISPWEMCTHLIAGAERILPEGGVLYLYGPYKREGRQTAPSNEAFDMMLRDRDSSWGIRDLEAVVAIAQAHNLNLIDVIAMPAHNFSVVFQATASPPSPSL